MSVQGQGESFILKLLKTLSLELFCLRGVGSEPVVPPLNSATSLHMPLQVQRCARYSPNTVETLRLTGHLSWASGGMS